MKNNTRKGINVIGSIRSAGITFYDKNGQTITRSSTSRQPKRRTLKQFIARARLAHSISLWLALGNTCKPLLTEGRYAYDIFRSLAAKLPPVFLTQHEIAGGAALLLPATPVSCGTLPDIGYTLGEVEDSPALVTDLTYDALEEEDSLQLVTLRQKTIRDKPTIAATSREVERSEFVVVDGHLALTGTEFADNMRGWALVRIRNTYNRHKHRREMRCSTQKIVTRCTFYHQYQTPEALQRSADSYGGLTGDNITPIASNKP